MDISESGFNVTVCMRYAENVRMLKPWIFLNALKFYYWALKFLLGTLNFLFSILATEKKMLSLSLQSMCSLSEEQSILQRGTIQKAFISELCPFLAHLIRAYGELL